MHFVENLIKYIFVKFYTIGNFTPIPCRRIISDVEIRADCNSYYQIPGEFQRFF